MTRPLRTALRHRHAAATLSLAASLLAAALAPAAARADATRSANWSGYAAHRTGTTFRTVRAGWIQPSGACTSGAGGYSAFWVGIGGYRRRSDALEQIGSELDCGADGAATAFAWYELVPAASRRIHMTIEAGDRLSAAVSITGDRVSLTLRDVTRAERFSRTVADHDLDLTSAEWIAEAPSDCQGSDCTTPPLADFGTVDFLRAAAVTSTGELGTVDSRWWDTTRIRLGASSALASTPGAPPRTRVTATPSAVSATDGGFSVVYRAAELS